MPTPKSGCPRRPGRVKDGACPGLPRSEQDALCRNEGLRGGARRGAEVLDVPEETKDSMKMIRKIALAGTAVMALTAAAPAFALTASVDEVTVRTIEDRKRIAVTKIHDNKAKVKGEYKRTGEGGSVRTIWNKNGYASTVKSGSGARVYSIQACEYKNNWPDDCSGWVSR